MKRLEGPLRCAPASVLAAAAFTLAMAGGAAAGEIARPPGAIDHRGYELVSRADKDGAQMHTVYLAPAGGDRVLYQLLGGVTGSPTGLAPIFSATRTEDGWRSQSFLPARSRMLRQNYAMAATRPDLSGAAVTIFDSLGTNPPDELLGRLGEGGTQTLLHQWPIFFGGFGAELVASDDLTHIFGNVGSTEAGDPIDPSHAPGTSDIYDYGSGTPVLVSRMPGTDLAPACGVRTPADGSAAGFAEHDLSASTSQHWASADGARVLFVTAGDDAPDCAAPPELYLRDLGALHPGITSLVSGPPVGGDPDNGVDRFLSANADGSRVYYRTATSLDPADDADADAGDMDVYRWSAATGANACLTCAVQHAEVSSSFGASVNAVVSQDGSHLYFSSPDQLADAPSAAADPFTPNLYVWRAAGNEVHFVAQVNGIATRSLDGGEATPDGSVLLFTSDQPGLDAISGRGNGGFMQYYRYDDRDGSVTCVSCPESGPATTSVGGSLTEIGSAPVRPDLRAVTDDGDTVFFSTGDRLADEDVNGDIDIYEWHDATVRLITDGTSHHSSLTAPRIVGTSPDGRDFYFLDIARLTSDAADDATKLYDARADGGFPSPSPPPPPCEGDACKPPPSSAPGLPDPPSTSLTDPGNLVPGSLSLARITAAQRARLAATGGVTLSLRVSGAGRVAATVQGTIGGHVHTVGRAAKSVRAAGTVKLGLRLSAAARRELSRRGRLRLSLTVRFSRAPASRRVAFTLVQTLPANGR